MACNIVWDNLVDDDVLSLVDALGGDVEYEVTGYAETELPATEVTAIAVQLDTGPLEYGTPPDFSYTLSPDNVFPDNSWHTLKVFAWDNNGGELSISTRRFQRKDAVVICGTETENGGESVPYLAQTQ